MGAGGRRLLEARDDVEVVAFSTTISAADFHTLLRSGGEVHGAILGLTRFGETECALARGLEVVARIGVGYDAIDVPALTRRRVPLMLVGTANSSSVAEHALFLMLTLAKRGGELDALVRADRWAGRRFRPEHGSLRRESCRLDFHRIDAESGRPEPSGRCEESCAPPHPAS